MSETPGLVPCPICGSARTGTEKAPGHLLATFRVRCISCHTSGPHAPSREQAIAAWNKRSVGSDRS